jgi:hypothetical protein
MDKTNSRVMEESHGISPKPLQAQSLKLKTKLENDKGVSNFQFYNLRVYKLKI